MGGASAGAEIFYLEPVPKKKYLEPEPEPRKNGSAPNTGSTIYTPDFNIVNSYKLTRYKLLPKSRFSNVS